MAIQAREDRVRAQRQRGETRFEALFSSFHGPHFEPVVDRTLATLLGLILLFLAVSVALSGRV